MKSDEEKIEEVLIRLDREIEYCPHPDHGYYGSSPTDWVLGTNFRNPDKGPYLYRRKDGSIFGACEKHKDTFIYEKVK